MNFGADNSVVPLVTVKLVIGGSFEYPIVALFFENEEFTSSMYVLSVGMQFVTSVSQNLRLAV